MQDPEITPELIAAHGLKPDEYERILDLIGREPSFTELGIFSAMWNEHCSYKSSKRWLRTLDTTGPQVLIGFLLGVVAVIVTTLNGLDRVPHVLRKTAAIARLSPLETALSVTLPFCAPYLITAAKLALAYAFIGVIGSEFIMARSGMGYEIGFAFLNFDNATMYPLIVLVLLLSVVLNGALTHWEKKLLARRGLQ